MDTSTWSYPRNKTSSICLRQHEMSQLSYHVGMELCTLTGSPTLTLTWPKAGLLFSALPNHETELDGHLVVRAAGPWIQQQSKGGIPRALKGLLFIQPFQWWGVFFFPLPNCLTHQSLTQGALCSIGFIPEDIVEDWVKASGSAVVLTDDISSQASISSIQPQAQPDLPKLPSLLFPAVTQQPASGQLPKQINLLLTVHLH